MDALARRQLSRNAPVYSVYSNKNLSFGPPVKPYSPTRSVCYSPDGRRRARTASPLVIKLPKPGRPGSRQEETELKLAKSKSEGKLVLRPALPSPSQYFPKVTTTGKEADMADLNGAELMQMPVFMSGLPARALPQHWGTVAERGVAKVDNHSPRRPAPTSYDPVHIELHRHLRGKILKTGRETNVPGTTWGGKHDELRALDPGPVHYDPQLMRDGKEYHMADLNGAERMTMSAFANTSHARAAPQTWSKCIFTPCAPSSFDHLHEGSVNPLQSLPSSAYFPGPGTYEPDLCEMSNSMDATMGMTARRRLEEVDRHMGWVPSSPIPDSIAAARAKLPGPVTYRPAVQSDGKEWDLSDLNGAERMMDASFHSTVPARGVVDEWATPKTGPVGLIGRNPYDNER